MTQAGVSSCASASAAMTARAAEGGSGFWTEWGGLGGGREGVGGGVQGRGGAQDGDCGIAQEPAPFGKAEEGPERRKLAREGAAAGAIITAAREKGAKIGRFELLKRAKAHHLPEMPG